MSAQSRIQNIETWSNFQPFAACLARLARGVRDRVGDLAVKLLDQHLQQCALADAGRAADSERSEVRVLVRHGEKSSQTEAWNSKAEC